MSPMAQMAAAVTESGRPHRNGGEARILRNDLYRKSIELERQGVSNEEYGRLFIRSMPRAVLDGDIENGSPMVGQIVGMLNKVQSAKEIIEDLIADYNSQPALEKIR